MNRLMRRKWGHPLKGESREKTPLPWKKIYFFRFTLDGFVKSPNKQADNVLKLNGSGFLRIHQFPATARPYFTTCPHPLFHFYRLSVSRYWSAPVTHQVQGDCVLCTLLKTRPLVHSDPRKSSVPYRVQLFLSQILWLLTNPLWTHGIGESGC